MRLRHTLKIINWSAAAISVGVLIIGEKYYAWILVVLLAAVSLHFVIETAILLQRGRFRRRQPLAMGKVGGQVLPVDAHWGDLVLSDQTGKVRLFGPGVLDGSGQMERVYSMKTLRNELPAIASQLRRAVWERSAGSQPLPQSETIATRLFQAFSSFPAISRTAAEMPGR